MIPPTWLFAGALALFVAGGWCGHRITAEHDAAKAAEAERAAAAAYQARTVELNTIAAQLEQSRHDRKTIYRTITRDVEKVVTRDVYRNECLDTDGLRIVNDALAGARTGQPDAAVPTTGAAAGDNGR